MNVCTYAYVYICVSCCSTKLTISLGCRANDEHALVVDFGAIDYSIPCTTIPSSIGNGVKYISKFMSSRLSGNSESAKPLLQHLKALNYKGEVHINIYATVSLMTEISD